MIQPTRPIRADVPPPFRILTCASPSLAGSAQLALAKAETYVFIDQNVDPGAASTGAIDPTKIIAEVARLHGPHPSGWGMLDYEVPFDSVIDAGPQHASYASVVAQMVEAIRRTKAAFPSVRWTYYGIPGLRFWLGGKLWAFASPSAQQAEIDRQIRNYGPVLAECDWFAPCVYDTQRNDALAKPEWRAQNSTNEVAYRKARIGVCREFVARAGLAPRPAVPVVCPFWSNGGNVAKTALIHERELVSDQIAPCADAADGLAVWLAPTWMLNVATRHDDGTDVQAEFREMFRRDFLVGAEPESWTDPKIKAALADGLSLTIARTVQLARATASARRGKQKSPTTETGAAAPKETD